MDWHAVLDRVVGGTDLTSGEARAAMAEIMAGTATPAQIAGLLVALRVKGESVEEMTGLVQAVRAAAVSVDVGVPVVDTAGTGGDRSGTFNISTAAAIIAAGAGAKVAKHGNRSASSKCGSADVLEALGVVIDPEPEEAARWVREIGFGFFFAPRYHPSFRHAAPIRRELGIPTVFNFLGPLANPVGATRQSIGVSDPKMAERMVGVLAELGSEYAFVFHGSDGLDEITTTGPTAIYRLHHGEVTLAEFTPEDFGVRRAQPEDLLGGSPADNAAIIRAVLAGERGPRRDASVVNAAPAVVVAGLASGFEEAAGLAELAIDSGAAERVLEALVAESHRIRSS